jgi:hypothetical protein
MSEFSSDENVITSQTARWKPWHKWVAGVVAALLIVQIYFVRELLAALILFTVLFLVVAIIVGIGYAIGRAGEAGFTFAEPAARRGMEMAEDLSRRTFRRPRSAPVP